MNGIDPNKYENIINKINKNKNDKNKNIRSYLINLSLRLLVVFVIFLLLTVIYRTDNTLKDSISSYFFKENISFTKIKKLYDKYLGGLLLTTKEQTITDVFNEELNYNSNSIYYDGVKLSVSENYLVPSLTEGMVVFVGDKENYGKTIIIENLEGICYWYGNIKNTSLKLYDYVEKGSFIGEVSSELYMIFSKDGKILNYEEYIN